jgi:hypothetical protein
MLSSSQTIIYNAKEHVIIQPDDKINVIILQMKTPNQKECVIIQPDNNINFILQPDDNINSVILSDGTPNIIPAQS